MYGPNSFSYYVAISILLIFCAALNIPKKSNYKLKNQMHLNDPIAYKWLRTTTMKARKSVFITLLRRAVFIIPLVKSLYFSSQLYRLVQKNRYKYEVFFLMQPNF